jgi:hypothetical protein
LWALRCFTLQTNAKSRTPLNPLKVTVPVKPCTSAKAFKFETPGSPERTISPPIRAIPRRAEISVREELEISRLPPIPAM